MGNVIIRKGVREDMQAVMDLIRELAEYERAAEEVEVTTAVLEQDGFGSDPAFEVFVAELEGKVVGAALYYRKYSTWKGKGMYLEDLVVSESMRRRGIGMLLFEALIKEARDRGYGRLEWQVLEWNTPAIEFYRKLGAVLDPEWINGKLTREQLVNHFKV